ncbi:MULTISPECIES: response regulator [Lysobacter]|uniref:Regulatory protein virG n=2 Tax=Lysobacter TaxID=68 RepID=A0A0S2DGY8_LYSEN|nr:MULTISPECIES: response regulator [Lysobacter]ALN57942.1 regulatory protein virG [Lysobacter enzymogenes]QCW26448.1 response regulator [Lysobacter enzymogenes]QQQ03698.1 response regulator [Lysobacter enzymogenes]UZW58399.1 response regulator [Lysobacter enzymogenes]WMT02112.1 response regulator [Lysobacter yananisis]
MLLPEQSQRPKVLVVEDDQALAHVIMGHIRTQGMDAYAATDSAEMSESMRQRSHDIVLLDLMLRQENGLDLLRALRRDSDVPVIIMTGHRRDEIDRVVGLELGADDYMPKPFGLHELTARVRAVLRRHSASLMAGVQAAKRAIYRWNDWQFDRAARALTSPEGESVVLTKGEHALLCAFIDAPGRPLSRDHLLRTTRIHDDVFDRSIDVQILRLRRKLERDPVNPQVIVTQRGHGYVFAPAVECI